jgi:hypothetical protein
MFFVGAVELRVIDKVPFVVVESAVELSSL